MTNFKGTMVPAKARLEGCAMCEGAAPGCNASPEARRRHLRPGRFPEKREPVFRKSARPNEDRTRRGERGATMVEFALVMVPFFILLFGILEVGLMFWGMLELENATDDAARMVRTGRAQAGNFDQARVKQEICSRVSLLVNCQSKVRVDVQSFASFGAMTPPSPLDGAGKLRDGFAFSLGGPQEVVLFSAFYEWPLINFMSSMSLSNMGSGNRLLRASAAFRNEPFPER